MAFKIEELRRPAAGAMYVSPARICVTEDGRLVDETDPAAVRLLVAEGGEIPASEAAEFGLIEGVETVLAAAAAADAAAGAAGGEDAATDLNELTVAELRERADKLGLDVVSHATKAEIIAAIEPPALSDLTVAELRERADELGLDVGSHAAKAEIIAAIEEAERARAAGGTASE